MHYFGSADSNSHLKAASLFEGAVWEQFGESESQFFIQLKSKNRLLYSFATLFET